CYGRRLPGPWIGRLFSRDRRSVRGRLLISEVGLARIALRFGTATGSAPSRAERSPVGSCDSSEVVLVSSAVGLLSSPVRVGSRLLRRPVGLDRTLARPLGAATGRFESSHWR